MKTMKGAMDSNKKKVMDRRVKEHQKVFRPRNKDVNAMKAMKVTMKAMKLRVFTGPAQGPAKDNKFRS